MISATHDKVTAIEVKWANQLRSMDLKTLKKFKNAIVLTKTSDSGYSDNIHFMPVYRFLMLTPNELYTRLPNLDTN